MEHLNDKYRLRVGNADRTKALEIFNEMSLGITVVGRRGKEKVAIWTGLACADSHRCIA